MMNPEVKKLLINALESGEYRKTTGVLARTLYDDEIGYCCLGVLCDLANKAGVSRPLELWTDSQGQSAYRVVFGSDEYDYQTSFSPENVNAWAGITQHDADVLVNINDNNSTFAPVVEYIKTNL